jgi:hypothetical protein
MNVETFERWQPEEAIPLRVEITAIRDEDEGLTVVLASEETRESVVKLLFQNVVAYRNINESFRIRTWQSQNMIGSSSLAIVEGSSWLRWLREESGGVLEEFSLTHYAIYTNDDCLDVAATAAPLVVRILPEVAANSR